MKQLIILRGLPGSGKSTLVKAHRNTFGPMIAKVCSADFFWDANGEYKYDSNMIEHAHNFCKLSAMSCMHCDVPLIYIDNTNIKKKNYKDYIQMAKQFGYDVKFLIPNTPWAWDVEECFNKNIHKVPKEVIQRMKDNFEKDTEFEQIDLVGE